MSDRVQLWSSGGGVQSTAIAVLIARGELPCPDLAVMSDTGRESGEALEYQRKHIVPMLAAVGVDFQIVHKDDWQERDVITTSKTGAVHLLPPFFSWVNGSRGKQPGFCSAEWKRTVVRRWANAQTGGREKFDVWIGFSTDELGRCCETSGKWQNWYPLIDKRLSRNDCIAIVEKHGLPTPPRSACWMCPNRSDYEWQHLKDVKPDEFEKAVRFEREIVEQFPKVRLHESGEMLDRVEFSDSRQQDFLACDTGLCFV